MKMKRLQRFTARRLEYIDHGPGFWKTQRIGVFDGETQIGDYEYGYSSGLPFYAFRQDDKWYALYCGNDYTNTRIMSLPDCKDIGGEAKVPGGAGFCAVEIWVPAYYVHHVDLSGNPERNIAPYRSFFKIHDDNDGGRVDGQSSRPESDWSYELFAFRSGCVWGDDSSWKLQMLDLRRVSEGLLTTQDIGYIELADDKLSLSDHIRLDEDSGRVYGMHVNTLEHFDEWSAANAKLRPELVRKAFEGMTTAIPNTTIPPNEQPDFGPGAVIERPPS